MSEPAAELPVDISVAEVDALRRAGHDFLLLDCREQDEWGLVRIADAQLLPMSEIQQRVGELEPHRQRRIVVHCHHGGRSLRVTHWLRQLGFGQVQNMAGGIDAWAEHIEPGMTRY